MTTFEKIQAIIVEEFGKDASDITMETSFEDMDVDSLDLFQVISEIEDEFDIQIDSEEGMKTVADLVAYVDEKSN